MQKFPFKVFVGNSGFEPDVTEWLLGSVLDLDD
jgi:hypothetical protein